MFMHDPLTDSSCTLGCRSLQACGALQGSEHDQNWRALWLCSLALHPAFLPAKSWNHPHGHTMQVSEMGG